MIKKQFYMGFVGFLGFLSFRYFYSDNLFDLSYIVFFAFFSNFITAKISGSKEDERYIENRKSALAYVGQFAIVELFIIWCAIMKFRDIAILCILVSISYVITLNLYAIKLYILEEK